MNAELFKEIKNIEKKAEEIVSKAENDKEKIIQDAKHKSLQLIEKEEAAIDKEKEDQIIEAKKQIGKEVKTILNEGKEDIRKINDKSAKNVDEAVDFVLDKFEESF